MEAVNVPVNNDTFFINDKAITGTTGEVFCRPKIDPLKQAPKGSVPIDRLIYRLVVPKSHYDKLHEIFANKRIFFFEVHRHLNPMLAVAAVISGLDKAADGNIVCIVEFGGLTLPAKRE